MKNKIEVIISLLAMILIAKLAISEAPYLTPDELFADSDVVCLARVERVERVWWHPDRKFAIAQVLDTWKGPKISSVSFRAYPTWTCDVSTANEGEIVLLFLSKASSDQFEIVNSGQGRWPLKKIGKDYIVRVSDYDIMPLSQRKVLKTYTSMSSVRNISLSQLKDFLQKGIMPK